MFPKFEEYLYPVLLGMEDGKKYKIADSAEYVKVYSHMTAADVNVKQKSGRPTYVYYTNMALTYLFKAGLINRVRQGEYQLAFSGRDLLSSGIKDISRSFLELSYPAYKKWVDDMKEGAKKRKTSVVASTEEDEVEDDVDVEDIDSLVVGSTTSYTKEDFLAEVFMTEDDYDKLLSLLRKKNIILQGAPGVGKTFTAKRLAYAMMGEKATDCVEMVQYHQNYAYEDFIMDYKPTTCRA